MCPVPNWPLCLIEIYEEPGFIDDGFRVGWSAIAMVNEPSEKHFWTTWDIVGDVAEMHVTESAASQGAGYRKDLSAKNLSTDTYPVLRARLKGADTQPYYKIRVEYTDASATDTGWLQAATDTYLVKNVELASAKTVRYLELYVKSGGGAGAEAKIWWDYAAVLKNPPLVPNEVEELDVDLQTTIAVSGFKFKTLNDSLFGSAVLHLSFDEDFGAKAYDLSRYKNHGTISGASRVSGRYGGALSFDGADDKVTVSDADSLDLSSAFTVCVWVKYSVAANRCVVDKRAAGGAINYRLYKSSDGSLNLEVYDGTHDLIVNTGAAYNDNVWHLAAVTWARGDKGCIYIDGVLKNNVPDTITGTITNNGPLTIGNSGEGGKWFNGLIDDVRVYSRVLTVEEIRRIYQESPRSGVARAGIGHIAMIYLAASDELLEQKLIKGRISQKESSGEPDNPTLTFSGEDYGRLLQDRTFTAEYATATQPSQILKDALDAEVPELTHESVNETDNAIKPRYSEQNIYALARDYAEACKDGSAIRGFDVWVDPGDDVRFKTLCTYTCPHRLSDGSDGYGKNIQAIRVRDSDEGLVNSVKVVIFEEQYEPRDRDSYTENKERWTLTAAMGSTLNEDADCKRGNKSIKANITAGSQSCQLSLAQDHSLYIDISQAEKIKFWIKSDLQNVDPNSVEITLCTDKSIVNTYSKISLGALPSSWEEKEYNLSDFSITGNPSKIVTRLYLYCEPTQGNTLSGNLWIDGLHFILPEKSKTSEDSTSISKYGKHRKRYVRKEVTDEDYAQYLATNLCQLNKNPTINISVAVRGKAQPGYRPPQQITVTSLKDGIDQKNFRTTRTRHHYIQGSYICELELIGAKTGIDMYEPKVYSREAADVGDALTNLQKKQEESFMGIVRGEWKS